MRPSFLYQVTVTAICFLLAQGFALLAMPSREALCLPFMVFSVSILHEKLCAGWAKRAAEGLVGRWRRGRKRP
jgi:hypothetical protein